MFSLFVTIQNVESSHA